MTRDQGNYSHPMKIVVTGGSGLLGSEVVRTLAAAGATTLPPIGGVLQAFTGGADLPDADATIGGSSFQEFLTP